MEHLDYALFFFINKSCSNSFFDAVAPYWRNMYYWLPVYVFLIAFIFQKLKTKAVIVLLGAVLTIALSDTISSKMIKPLFKRARPCQQVFIEKNIHFLVPCGSGYSFPSSHAANHFALSFYLIGLPLFQARWIKTLLIFWASTVALAQVYVGLHYPFDIFCGALLGAMVGFIISKIVLRFL